LRRALNPRLKSIARGNFHADFAQSLNKKSGSANALLFAPPERSSQQICLFRRAIGPSSQQIHLFRANLRNGALHMLESCSTSRANLILL